MGRGTGTGAGGKGDRRKRYKITEPLVIPQSLDRFNVRDYRAKAESQKTARELGPVHNAVVERLVNEKRL